MDILYAPWRDQYVTKNKEQKSYKDDAVCVFCNKLHDYQQSNQASKIDDFILKVTANALVILNLYPYNGGHILILPRQHVADLQSCSSLVRAELMELVTQSCTILEQTLHAQGINVGINLGRASGAGIPAHLHIHLVPRWVGDTSFITVIGKTKNVSVDLEKIYTMLLSKFEQINL